MTTSPSTLPRTSPRGDKTPDSHSFPTRPYDLVKEFVVALVVVAVLSVALAAVFSSPDEKSITMSTWANEAPNDLVATATSELAASSTSAGYGAPYNTNGDGQKLGPLSLQKWGGVRIPVDSASLVLGPLSGVSGDRALTSALGQWKSAAAGQQTKWATDYGDALAKAPDGDPTKVAAAPDNPVPVLSAALVTLAKTGGLEGILTSSGNFYGGDQTKSLLLLSDGTYLEDQAVARKLGGDQWGMMNETGNFPGQPWMWLYTFWYQVSPFATSDNADAQVWGLMMLLTLGLTLIPFIPGLRSIPRWIPIHRLVWRNYYRGAARR
jgi:hypothetical protein